MIPHPPQLNGYELRHSVALRFVANASLSVNITFQNLMDTILFAASATAGYNVFQTVKVRRVRVWSVPVIGNAATVIVEYSGVTPGITGDQALHADTSMGIQPAYVSCRPSRRSLASNYQLNSGALAFTLTCPSGSVVDVELSFRGAFGLAVAEQNALVGAVTGATYLRGLDGKPTATTVLPVTDGGSQ
jgi:hypothetical protein